MSSAALPSIAVLGSGSWGTALAIQLARTGRPVPDDVRPGIVKFFADLEDVLGPLDQRLLHLADPVRRRIANRISAATMGGAAVAIAVRNGAPPGCTPQPASRFQSITMACVYSSPSLKVSTCGITLKAIGCG